MFNTSLGADEESVQQALQTDIIVDAGLLGGGEGFRVYEELIREKVRKFIFSKDRLLERVIEGNTNLKGIQSLSTCHANKRAYEEGFTFSASTIGMFIM